VYHTIKTEDVVLRHSRRLSTYCKCYDSSIDYCILLYIQSIRNVS